MTKMTFGIDRIDSLPKALEMRRIYNAMNPRRVGLIKQIMWFFKHKRSENRAYLVITDGVAVGYGLVMDIDGEWTTAGSVMREYRGMDRVLFRFLSQDALLSSGKDVYTNVDATDILAVKLCVSLGYEPVNVNSIDGTIKMKWSGKLVSV